jgi:hypothetical protein
MEGKTPRLDWPPKALGLAPGSAAMDGNWPMPLEANKLLDNPPTLELMLTGLRFPSPVGGAKDPSFPVINEINVQLFHSLPKSLFEKHFNFLIFSI